MNRDRDEAEARSPLPVSVVVVNYNAGKLLADCVSSLIFARAQEVLIVDNASSDTSVADAIATVSEIGSACDVRVVQTGTNLGYGKAANLGFPQTNARYVAICNPDVTVEGSALEKLTEFLITNKKVGIVGPKIEDALGRDYPSVRRFPSLGISAMHALLGQLWPKNRFSRFYKSVDSDALGLDRWLSGAFLVLERSFLLEIGGFDPAFFMFMEDVELCSRVIASGREIGYEKRALVTHRQGSSSAGRPYFVLYHHHRSLWIYARKTVVGLRRPLLLVVAPGILFRFSVGVARTFLRGRIK